MFNALEILTEAVDAAVDDATGTHPARGGRGQGRRRRQAEKQVVSGARPWIAKLFNWLAHGQLSCAPQRLSLTFDGSGVIFVPGRQSLAKLAAEFAPDKATQAKTFDDLLAGQPFQLNENRTLILPTAAPLPSLTLKSEQLIEASWQPAATVKQGRFTAKLPGISITPDGATVHAEWRLLGIDLARDPVVLWGD